MSAPGKLLCADTEATYACGYANATYISGYTLNLKCDQGFYDPMQGGTCWKCPDDDGNGSWIRGADPVESDTACWRAPKESLSSAVWDKHGMSWDCSSGQFWDAIDTSGSVNGSCWHCPSDYPRRTGYAVNSSQACASPTNQTNAAIFLKYNGCTAPDQAKLYPHDKRRPGKPFLDIASGISVAGNAGGACWVCPVSDEQGNYLNTDRSAGTLINNKNGTQGCVVNLRYQPGKFVEPGLGGLAGAADVLRQEQLFQRPGALTKFLFAMATKRKLSGAQATQWVADQWKDIAAHPFQNENVRALMYQYMLGHAPSYMYASGTAGSGAAQQKLAAAFQVYIQARRTFVGQEALNMYYAWKQNVDVKRTQHAQSQLQTLFYYGTVPLDFQSIVAAVLVPTATGVGVLGSVIASESFAATVTTQRTVGSFTTAARAVTLFQAFQSFEAFEALDLIAAIDVVSGPVGIALAGATMAAMAIQQVVQIATAEQNLKDARDKARNTPIDLFALYNQSNGPDQVSMYWSFATGVTAERDDPQIVAAAQSAYAAAQQSNFAQLQTTPPPQQATLAQQTAAQQTYAQYMSASATLLQLLRRVADGPSAKAAQPSIQNALTAYNNTKARLAAANLGNDQRNAANSQAQQVAAEITRIKGIPAANQVLGNTFATTKYHGAD
jgi:hypothetical protein